MNHSTILKQIILAILILLMGCSNEIDFSPPSLEKSIVINGILQPDSIVKITVSESYEIFNDSLTRLDQAIVMLYKDQSVVDILQHNGNGLYITDIYPDVNYSYSVELSLYDKVIYATDSIPGVADIDQIARINQAGIDADGCRFEQAVVTIMDPGDTKDFYEVRLGFHTHEGKNGEFYPYTEDDPVLINEGLPFYYSSAFPFSDEIFNGTSKKIAFNYLTPKRYVNDSTVEKYPDYGLIVEVRKSSRDYYLFRRSYLIQQHAKYPDFWDGLGNPVSLHSNIEGGLGIFASFNSVTDTIY